MQKIGGLTFVLTFLHIRVLCNVFSLLVLFQELNHVSFYVSTWYSQFLTQTTNQVCLYY